jgi:hypothetical protein
MDPVLSDDAVVAYLRERAPGLPTTWFDARAVTARARGALRRRRRFRNSAVAVALAGATTGYLAIAVAGPVPVPGLGTVSVPGVGAVRAMVGGLFPGIPPGPGQWDEDVDRLDREVLPVVQRLDLSYYILREGPCHLLEYPRGDYVDGGPDCGDLARFDAQARADFDELTAAVERTGVTVERIYRHEGGVYVQLDDYSWQYNWAYVYLPDGASPPVSTWPEEEWTRVRGDWWFYRAHDD